MIDIRLARENPEMVTAALARKGVDPSEVKRLLDADRRARQAMAPARRAALEGEGVVAPSGRGPPDRRRGAHRLSGRGEPSWARRRAPSRREATAAQAEVRELLLLLPNLPSPEAPDGEDDSDNMVVRRCPEKPGATPSIARAPLGRGRGARHPRPRARCQAVGLDVPAVPGGGAGSSAGLTAFALDHHAPLYEEIRPPTLVRTETMVSTGHLPKFSDDAYHLERDDLWAIPTAEVPLTSMYRDEILDEADLPIRLTAGTACFRREAGAGSRHPGPAARPRVRQGRAVRLRHRRAVACRAPGHGRRAEALLQELELEYRVVDLCTGELGNSAARTFDIEVYAPGGDMWLEVSSVSWCTDYQARRANIRYRGGSGSGGSGSGGSGSGGSGSGGSGSTVFVHTLNGSAIAWARVWAALVENGRQPDGSVVLPSALAPYLGGNTVIEAPAS